MVLLVPGWSGTFSKRWVSQFTVRQAGSLKGVGTVAVKLEPLTEMVNAVGVKLAA